MRSAFGIDPLEGLWLSFEEFEQLAGGTVQSGGGDFEVESAAGDEVQRFGEDGGVIFVFGIHGDSGVPAPFEPQGAGLVLFTDRSSHGEREVDAQAMDRGVLVVGLTSSFAGLGEDMGGSMVDDDGGFDLVSVLSTRAG